MRPVLCGRAVVVRSLCVVLCVALTLADPSVENYPSNVAARPWLYRSNFQILTNNCFRVDIHTKAQLATFAPDKSVIRAKEKQFDFLPNTRNFLLPSELSSAGPPKWAETVIKPTFNPAYLSSISKWSCGDTLLKIGTGGSSDNLNLELGNAVGSYLRYCHDIVKKPLRAEVCFVYVEGKRLGNVDEQRVAGEFFDIESVEWWLRCKHQPANHCVDAEGEQLDPSTYGFGESDLRHQQLMCGRQPLLRHIERTMEQSRERWRAIFPETIIDRVFEKPIVKSLRTVSDALTMVNNKLGEAKALFKSYSLADEAVHSVVTKVEAATYQEQTEILSAEMQAAGRAFSTAVDSLNGAEVEALRNLLDQTAQDVMQAWQAPHEVRMLELLSTLEQDLNNLAAL